MASVIEVLSRRENVTRIITTMVILSFVIPYLNPIGLPLTVSEHTRATYDIIHSLQPGDIVLIDQNWGGYGERTSGTIAIMQDLFEMPGVRMVIMSCDAPGLSQLASDLLLTEGKGRYSLDLHGKVYGTDFVYLGFTPGWEPMIAAFAQNPTAVFAKDYYGNPTADMPIFQAGGFIDYNDIDLVFAIEGKHTTRYFIYQWGDPFGITIVSLPTMKDFVEYVMYYPHSVQGMLAGGRGGAEYELLRGVPGVGLALMDAMSVVSMVAILFLIIGNVSYLYRKRMGQRDVWERTEVFKDQTYDSDHEMVDGTLAEEE